MKKKLYRKTVRIGFNYHTEYVNEKDMIKYLRKYNPKDSMKETRKKLKKYEVKGN